MFNRLKFVNYLCMKRLLTFFIVSVLTLSVLPCSSKSIFDADFFQVCIISDQVLPEEDFLKVLRSGDQFYYYSNEKDVYKEFSDIKGVVLYFENYSLQALANDFCLQYFAGENVDGKSVYYGFTPYFDKSIQLNSKRINVQIVLDGEQIIAGFPAILTGF